MQRKLSKLLSTLYFNETRKFKEWEIFKIKVSVLTSSWYWETQNGVEILFSDIEAGFTTYKIITP